MNELIRHCIFFPYPFGMGPIFHLHLYDTGRSDPREGKTILAYRLSTKAGTIFEGQDFGCSSFHAIDSDACVKSLMGFLCLQPGDTDKEYFENYTAEQLAFCHEHAEALGCSVNARFGCDE